MEKESIYSLTLDVVWGNASSSLEESSGSLHSPMPEFDSPLKELRPVSDSPVLLVEVTRTMLYT